MATFYRGVFSLVDATRPISLRCPSCRQIGVFEPLTKDITPFNSGVGLGHRQCPNEKCSVHVFTTIDFRNGVLLAAHPPELIDFDSTDIPLSIVAAFQEALQCHAAQCYVASAIMVRKTLEILCDEQGATGKNLKERVKDLGTKIILPKPLLDGLDSIRLLGNDAAHVESQVFAQIGEGELDVAIELTKEVLKATYQYSNLLQKLEALKTQNQPPP